MFCNNCGTEFEVTKIDNGKNRFCRSCGSLLYKNQNGQLIDSEGKPFINAAIDKDVKKLSIDEEHQKLLEQERLIKERQNQLLNQKREQELREQKEKERIEQELLQKERQEQLIKDQQERERQEAERKEKERLLQLHREQEEKERLLREKIEKEVREKIQREQAEKERLERELKEKLERERIERELRDAEEKQKAAQLLLEKEADERRQAEQIEQEKAAAALQSSGGTLRKFLLFVLLPLLLAGILAGATYFLFPQQIKAALGINTPEARTTKVVSTPENVTTDNVAIIEQLKIALTGKEVLSWGLIKADEIKELTIQSQQAGNGSPSYVVELNLDDNAGTKAAAELDVSYMNNIIDKTTTNKISYKNTAPVNAWFSFAPLKNCTILVNTNGNPIKLKGCQNCPSVSLNTSAEQPEKLINHPETIFIQSGSATEAEVDFTYVPIK